MTNPIKNLILILKKKRRNHLIKKYAKILDQRTKSTRKAYRLIGLP